MELITLAAVMCHLGVCQERVITNSDLSGITLQECKMHAQFGIAQFVSQHPQFADYEIKSWRCVAGTYVQQREV